MIVGTFVLAPMLPSVLALALVALPPAGHALLPLMLLGGGA
jgi:hypothetical protein